MGTSSLYKGPKKSYLLPSDYVDDSSEQRTDVQESAQQDGDNQNTPDDSQDSSIGTEVVTPSVSWGAAKRTMTKSYAGGSRQIRNAVKQYTKALGGHKNAARQATSAKRVTSQVISFFSGSASDIKSRIEEAGIRFEGRSTSDIFLDIRDLLAPSPDTLEDSYINKAVNDTIAEILSDNDIDSSSIDDVLNTDILERMTCGVIKYYIYEKLMSQDTLGVIKHETNPARIKKFEKTLMNCIDGFVMFAVPPILKDGMGRNELNNLVNELYEACYKSMEGTR